jgi:DNA-binding NarL/FixJ family response regulator
MMYKFQPEQLAQSPILVLEDYPAVQTAIKLALKRGGMNEVSFARTIAEAKELFDRTPHFWVCAILDARLPDGSGLDMARHIAEQNPTCGLVVLTARWDDAVLNESLAIPVHAFGHKPFDIEGPAALAKRAIVKARGLELRGEAASTANFGNVAGGLPRSLTAKQRYIVAMRLADRSYAEISEVVSISVETVRSHLKHARARMRGEKGEPLSATVMRASALEFENTVCAG